MRERGTAAIKAKWQAKRDDAFADYLTKIRKRREQGQSYKQIAEWLNTTDCPTAKGRYKGTRFYPATIQRLLASEA
jgi:hypothetical protein